MTTVTQGFKWKKADLAFLGVALAAHTGLVLLPLEVLVDKPPPLEQRLSLELVHWRAPTEPVPKVSDPNPEADIPTSPLNPEPLVEVLPVKAMTRPAEPLNQPADVDSVTSESEPLENLSPDRLSAAFLMNSPAKPALPQIEYISRKTLGVHSHRGVPSNWQKRNRHTSLLIDESGLNIAMAPAQTEIVDRWLDAQGAQNVVVNLPNGETFCGRAEAWDPMQPLVEHIMMFRPCGGGGKRTFEMASRPTPRWSTVE